MTRRERLDREDVLRRIREALAGRPRAPLPSLWSDRTPGALGWDDFGAALEDAEGELAPAASASRLRAAVEALAGGASWTACGIAADLLAVEESAPTDPTQLQAHAWMVAWGFAAVARSGAVAVDSRAAAARTRLLLPENLLLIVPEAELVDDLDALYERVLPETLAGGTIILIAGPSKTADIEQTLVTGAHGPRRLVVMPYREET